MQFRDTTYEGGANKESLNQAKEAWLASSTQVCVITGDEGGIEYVYSRLANDLSFPAYFGKNADALNECLADVKKARIVWNGSKQAKNTLGQDFEKIVSIFEYTSKENPDIKLALQ